MIINYPLIISLIFFVNYALMFIHVNLHTHSITISCAIITRKNMPNG